MDITTHYEKIVSNFARWKSAEAERASEVGEMREEIGSVIELTGLNKKAFAFVRMLDKQEQDKRDDILRSLMPLLAMMDTHWNGNRTPDMFVEPVEPIETPRKPTADLSPEIRAESDDFDRHLAEVAG